MTALEIYDRIAPDAPASWAALAADLRAEADRHTGDQRRKRLDRALACEYRAQRRSPAESRVAEVHRRLAAPGHKTAIDLLCECGRALADRQSLVLHQLCPWLDDHELRKK